MFGGGAPSIGSAQPVIGALQGQGLNLNPQQQMALAQTMANQQAQAQQQMSQNNLLFGANVAAQAANNAAIRQAALQNQAQTANLVGQQLAGLANMRAQSGQMINQALATGAGI